MIQPHILNDDILYIYPVNMKSLNIPNKRLELVRNLNS